MDMVYRDTTVGFHRLNPGPIDDQMEFESNADLLDYCKNRTAYHGQRVILKYGFYDQPCIIKKATGNVLVPVVELPSGIELLFKKIDEKPYVMVFYYNDTIDIPGDDNNRLLCFNKPYYFAMLPQCSLFANNNTSIKYRMEINDEVLNLTQGNPLDVVSTAQSKSVFDRAKENMIPNYIVRIWVECSDYYKAMGVE